MPSEMHATEADIQREVLETAQGHGWELISRVDMNELRGKGRMNEGIVESLLVDAIQELNPGVGATEAREVAARVRRIGSDREMFEALREGVPYKAAPDEPTRDIAIVDSAAPLRNRFVVTEEFSLHTGGLREPRLDVVFLVNGIPLGAWENKDPRESISAAAADWRGYWSDAPQLVTQVAVVACSNGLQAVVGPSGCDGVDGYMAWTDPWPRRVDDPEDEVQMALAGAFHPEALVDLASNFVVFETREGVTAKKLARAHQFRAANKIVERVATGALDRGIVWHATGSGKSLTMIFAARKLQRSGLGGPLVLIVIDRTELDEQINQTLTACEFDGIERARTRRHLESLLRPQAGGVVVTTVHKFDDEMAGMLDRREVIAFVDEAHRTQFGRFGAWMRSALPNASLFAFTGTPIEQVGRSTRRSFSPRLADGSYEPYLDRYGFDEAIADGATVPLVYEARLPDWHVSAADLDQRLAELTPGLSEDERDALRERSTRQVVVAKAPERVAAVAADVVDQMRSRVSPLGLVGQLVAVDRVACSLFAEQLSGLLGEDEFAVIMSRSKNDSAPVDGEVDLRRWYPAAQWERVHGAAAIDDEDTAEEETDDGFLIGSDRAAIKDLIARFKRPGDPLCLLVVNRMLLTGFDAPNEGALFLDRGLRSHSLMQAINRPNRRFREKDAGLVFDYWGLLSDLDGALSEFAREDLAGLVVDSEQLVERFPLVLDEAVHLLEGSPEGSSRRRMLWIVRRLTDDPDRAQRFAALIREAQSIFELLSPDPRLAACIDRYTEVLRLWKAWTRGTRRDRGGNDVLRGKTQRLVQEAIGLDRIRDELPAATIDADFLSALRDEDDLTPEDVVTDIEAAIVHEIEVRGKDDPLARSLAERLADLRAKQEREAQTVLEALTEWEALARQHVEEAGAAGELDLSRPAALALAVLRRSGPEVDDEILVATATCIGDRHEGLADFPGWSERPDIVKSLRKAVVSELAARPELRPLASRTEPIDELLAGLATLDTGLAGGLVFRG